MPALVSGQFATRPRSTTGRHSSTISLRKRSALQPATSTSRRRSGMRHSGREAAVLLLRQKGHLLHGSDHQIDEMKVAAAKKAHHLSVGKVTQRLLADGVEARDL